MEISPDVSSIAAFTPLSKAGEEPQLQEE